MTDTASNLDTWIEREFRGYGMAMRRREDPPIPGEPLMSMAVAKELTRKAVRAFAPPAPTVGREEIARVIRKMMVENWVDAENARTWNEDILLVGCKKAGGVGGHGYVKPEEAAQNLALLAADAILSLPTDGWRGMESAQKEITRLRAENETIGWHLETILQDAGEPSCGWHSIHELTITEARAAIAKLPAPPIPEKREEETVTAGKSHG